MKTLVIQTHAVKMQFVITVNVLVLLNIPMAMAIKVVGLNVSQIMIALVIRLVFELNA